MHGAAITLAEQYLKCSENYDLILASDFLDLTIFLSLTRSRTASIPTAIYFHENQFAYPLSPRDSDQSENRNAHFGFINLSSALAADRVFFNSQYNLESFFQGAYDLLKKIPDYPNLASKFPTILTS